jgi:predicted branched-subunit amino acid permease
MGGAVIMVVVLLLFPVVVLMTGAIAAAILGELLKRDAEQAHQGSELLDLNT